MANFLLIGDPDPGRRRRMMRAARDRVALLDGLVVSSAELPPFGAVWAAGPSAPVSVARQGSERLAVLWGEPRLSDGSLLDAADLDDRWGPDPDVPAEGVVPPAPRAPSEAFDGYFAAALMDARGRLQVGADVLGLFPVYHAECDGVALVGSSPELFRLHPLYTARLDRRGLTALLLIHAFHAGRTLLRGVRRLPPAHLFRWERADGGHEVCHYRIPEPEVAGGEFRDHVLRFDRAWDRAVRRHAPPGEEVGLLLSGGRDSRLLAGYLSGHGAPFRALTFGRSDDHEVRCARAVARELDLPHDVYCAGPADFRPGAEITAGWEHLAGGFSNIHTWAAVDALRRLPPRVVVGHLRESREIKPFPDTFDALLERANLYGIPPETLETLLLDAGGDDLVRAVARSLGRDFETRSADPGSRGWRFYLAHLWRSIVGTIPWRFSFGSWPAVPALDRDVLATMASLPEESLGNRRVQDHVLCERFPALARLPLDRNSEHTLPLLPTWWDRAELRVRRLLTRLPSPLRGEDRERRYYYRMHDLNGPGWRRVRRRAEPHRERLVDVFDMDSLARLVPPPEEDIQLPNMIRDGHAPKLLLGLMLWAERHLP